MITPNTEWTLLQLEAERLDYMKRTGLLTATATQPKALKYHGFYTDTPVDCYVAGHSGPNTCIVEVGDSLHCISADYLAEMQQHYYNLPERYVVLDLETTGLESRDDDIIEIAAIKFDRGRETGVYTTLVSPGYLLPEKITALTGITDDMLRDAPAIQSVIPQLADFLSDYTLVAHNAPFDLDFLKKAFRQCGLSLVNKSIDTVKLARRAFPDCPNHRLGTLTKHLGISLDGAHRALADAYATAELLTRCAAAPLSRRSSAAAPATPKSSASQPAPAPAQAPARKSRFEHIPLSSILPTVPANPSHPLFGCNIVFTGELALPRREAFQLAVDCGAVLKSSVSAKTDYLVVGRQDPGLVSSGGQSSKERKAHELIEAKQVPINIIDEETFLALANYTPEAQ